MDTDLQSALHRTEDQQTQSFEILFKYVVKRVDALALSKILSQFVAEGESKFVYDNLTEENKTAAINALQEIKLQIDLTPASQAPETVFKSGR